MQCKASKPFTQTSSASSMAQPGSIQVGLALFAWTRGVSWSGSPSFSSCFWASSFSRGFLSRRWLDHHHRYRHRIVLTRWLSLLYALLFCSAAWLAQPSPNNKPILCLHDSCLSSASAVASSNHRQAFLSSGATWTHWGIACSKCRRGRHSYAFCPQLASCWEPVPRAWPLSLCWIRPSLQWSVHFSCRLCSSDELVWPPHALSQGRFYR